MINVLDYGAVADANYYNEADGQYYKDEAFTILPTDNTDAFREALLNASGKTLYIPAGRYMILGTLWVKSNTIIQGDGMGVTHIYVGDGNVLDSTLFRDTNVKPIVITESGSGQITFKDFTLHGNWNQVDYEEWGVAGLLAKETEQIKVNRVDVSWINTRRTLISSYQGWAITSLDCDDVEYYRCRSEYGGYQNFGFFDRTTNGLMHECFSGFGRRTSTQVHRDVDNIKILNNTIINTPNLFNTNEPHGALTIHGEPNEEVRNLTVDGNYIEMSGGTKAAIQAFRKSEHMKITNNEIKSNGEGIRVGDAYNATVEHNKLSSLEGHDNLEYGNIGINVIDGTANSRIRYNEVIGFDIPIHEDANLSNDISDNDIRNFIIQQARLFKNVNGKVVEVEPYKKVNGVAEKVIPYVRY